MRVFAGGVGAGEMVMRLVSWKPMKTETIYLLNISYRCKLPHYPYFTCETYLYIPSSVLKVSNNCNYATVIFQPLIQKMYGPDQLTKLTQINGLTLEGASLSLYIYICFSVEKKPVQGISQMIDHRSTMNYREKLLQSSYLQHEQSQLAPGNQSMNQH